MKSVLQDWVMEISLRQQGVLVIALRGPDGVRKEDAAKPLVRTLRALVMNSGRECRPMEPMQGWGDDPFMTTMIISQDRTWRSFGDKFFDQWDAYNVHFLQHLLHAYAVCGIHHPNGEWRDRCWAFYVEGCHKIHMHAETKDEIQYRLRDGIRADQGEAA